MDWPLFLASVYALVISILLWIVDDQDRRAGGPPGDQQKEPLQADGEIAEGTNRTTSGAIGQP